MYFANIAASRTATDSVMNWVTLRIFNTKIYSCAYFTLKFDSNLPLLAGSHTIY